jgi:hypothetical protein
MDDIERLAGELIGDVSDWRPTGVQPMDDGYELLVARIRRGTTINGAIVALCPAPDANGNVIVTADVCIDGPPVK